MSISNPLHLEIQRHRKNYYGILRTSYREDGKVKHTSHGRITGLSHERLRLIQAALRGNAIAVDSEDMPKTMNSKEYGASYSIFKLAKELELDKIIYSKPNQQWVKDSLAMIVGRLVYAGSKLSLSNRYKDTALWELCGVNGAVDVEEHCYKSMDCLLRRQKLIQKKLAEKHLSEQTLILYDITSSYFEGEYKDSYLIKFGYNRDQKKGHEQIVIGLICNSEGCPIAIEVFQGNTKDETTVEVKIAEIQQYYNVKQLFFVGDRGMLTQSNIKKFKDKKEINIITALTHNKIKELIKKKIITANMFCKGKISEIQDPENSNYRYCLCYGNSTAEKSAKTREELLNKVYKELEKITSSKRKSTTEKISSRIGKILYKTKTGKYIDWKVQNGKLEWSFKQDIIEAEKLLDGCYVIFSDIPKKKFNTEELVAAYKKLSLVERAFRNLKMVQLEIRPVYHKTDNRIRCHVFLCMLAYYLQWHMSQRLKPLFEKNGKHKKRFWTFENVIERLKSIRQENVVTAGTICQIINRPDEDQKTILNLLGIAL